MDCDEWVGDNVCLPFKDVSGNLFLNKMFTLRINHQFNSSGSFLSVCCRRLFLDETLFCLNQMAKKQFIAFQF